MFESTNMRLYLISAVSLVQILMFYFSIRIIISKISNDGGSDFNYFKEKKFINALKRGDRVITKSGMHGKVIEVNNENNTCVLETMAGKIKFDKTAISLEMSSKLIKKT